MILSTLENGKIVKAPCSTVDFDYSCDVLCVGAGGAGVYAADSAAREGLDKKELHGIFTELFSGDKLLHRITREAEGAPAHEEVSSFTSYMLKITE